MRNTVGRAIEIVAYQERWPREFETIGCALRATLGSLALRIDHIGSTSVPELAAKDIIDVQVTVADLADPAPSAALRAAGYEQRQTVGTDHQPPKGPSGDGQWSKLFFRERPGERRTHVHVRQVGRANQRYPLVFRDFLRVHPHASEAYLRTKRALAELAGDDRSAYADAKDPVCDLIMVSADLWAERTGWSPGQSDA